MHLMRRTAVAAFLMSGTLGLLTLGQAAATPGSIPAWASVYAPSPDIAASFAGQLAADPAGNLYIALDSSCQIYKVSAAHPTDVATILPNTLGSWCGGPLLYGLVFAHTINGDVLVTGDGSSISEVPIDGVTAPLTVGDDPGTAYFAYDAASDTLAMNVFAGRTRIIGSFSTCSATSQCSPQKPAISGQGSARWGVSVAGGRVLMQSATTLLGYVGLTGGALTPFGPSDAHNFGDFVSLSQDAAGNAFAMDPDGALWEVPAGTTEAIPFQVTGSTGHGGYFAMVYSNGAIYAYSNNGDQQFVKFSLSDTTTTTTSASTTTTAAGPVLARTGGGLLVPGGISMVLLVSGIVLVCTSRRRIRSIR